MILALELRTSLWIFLAIIFSFTVGMLSLRTHRIWNGAPYWLAGNATSMVALLILLWMQENTFPLWVAITPVILIITANMLKTASLMSRAHRIRALVAGIIMPVTYILIVVLFDDLVEANLRLGLFAVMAAIPSAWQAWLCHSSPQWRNIEGSRRFAITGLALTCYFLLVATRGFSLPDVRFLFQRSGLASLNLIASVSYFVVIHICLIAMLAARVSRTVAASQMRQRKQLRLTQLAEHHAMEMATAAAEKQSLLEVLTHEVRQPLNNAQAALHDVMMTVSSNTRDYAAGQRLQSIIDQIVLTLSNAIVGASMLERKSQSLLVRTDILSVAELACSDAGVNWRERIDLTSPNGQIFAEADPILLRLAIRNLLDNALKHSPAGQKAQIVIAEDEANLAVAITVRNWPAQPLSPTANLFERGVRGDKPVAEGKGLGLYIVQEISLLHGGSASFSSCDDGSVAFRLTIPA